MTSLFPLFIDLSDKQCLIIGAGKVAQRKILTLLKFTENITVISPKVTDTILKIAEENEIKLIKKAFCEADINGYFLVVAATDNRELNHLISIICKSKDIFVNVADSYEDCTFVFPAVSKYNNIVAGITSSGQNPKLTKELRKKIDKILNEISNETE